METSTPPPTTSTPSPAIGFEHFASMFNSFSEQLTLINDKMKKSNQKLTTPQSSLGADSDNDWIGIGSKTSSERSYQTTESSSSKLSSQSNRKRIPTEHRHFKYQLRRGIRV